MKYSIWIGWDPREADAFGVARDTARYHLGLPVPIYGLVLDDLIEKGLYRRPIEMRPSAADKPVMWDVISDAPMSTQHANARFLVPFIAKTGWALFMDGDVLVRSDLWRLFSQLDRSKAVYCVKHKHKPKVKTKMDGQVQTSYARKNWTSVMAWNCDHPSNKDLTLDMVNSLPGRDLHALCWLRDDEIGELGPEWNYLVGETKGIPDPKICHFTSGLPSMEGYADCEYADEWRTALRNHVRGHDWRWSVDEVMS